MVVENYKELSQKSAQMFYQSIINKRAINLGLATGGTPVGFYQELVKFLKGHDMTECIRTFNLDEYIGLSKGNPNSFYTFMNDHFYKPLNLSDDQTFIPNGKADDLEDESSQYETLIQSYGGIDLQLLGVGENGHIGFNEPGSHFEQRTHVVNLKPSTVQANARFFNSIKDVPKKAITMGIGTILDAKEIIVIANGEHKAEAIYQLVHGEKSRNWPITALKGHSNVTVILDEAAANKVKLRQAT